MRKASQSLSAEGLREMLHYDPETGAFRWLCDPGCPNRKAGTIAGGDNGSGYIRIGISGRKYYAHRLAFFYMTGDWPKAPVDHQDGNSLNNKWKNLREADRSNNAANMKTPRSNTSGVKGVTWSKKEEKWVAQICVNYRNIYLGSFDCIDQAAKVRKRASRQYFGEFARAG